MLPGMSTTGVGVDWISVGPTGRSVGGSGAGEVGGMLIPCAARVASTIFASSAEGGTGAGMKVQAANRPSPSTAVPTIARLPCITGELLQLSARLPAAGTRPFYQNGSHGYGGRNDGGPRRGRAPYRAG